MHPKVYGENWYHAHDYRWSNMCLWCVCLFEVQHVFYFSVIYWKRMEYRLSIRTKLLTKKKKQNEIEKKTWLMYLHDGYRRVFTFQMIWSSTFTARVFKVQLLCSTFALSSFKYISWNEWSFYESCSFLSIKW